MKSIFYMFKYIMLALLVSVPAFAADTFREVLMQNAASGTGNGTSITVDYFTTVSVEVTITGTATITWEESISNSSKWNGGTCVLASAPATLVTTATATGLYHCNLSALTNFRARISSYGSGTVTAFARITQFDFQNIMASSSGGGGGDGAILDGVSASIKATVFDFTNSNPLGVVLRDTNGDYVAAGGGTQYDQGTATTDTDKLTMAGCVRADTAAVATGVVNGDRARCIVDATGQLWVNVGTGTVTANAGTNLNTSALLTTAAHDNAFGTAGTADTQVRTIQGIAGMTKVLVTPDSVALPANQSVNVAQAGGTNISTGTGASGAGIPRVTISNDSSLAANQSVNAAQIAGTNTVTGGVAGLLAVGGNVANAGTATANPVPVGGIFTTTPTTLTTGQTATAQYTAAQNLKTDMSTIAGTVTSTAAAGVQKVGVVGNAGAIVDAAQNAATPANNLAMGCNFTTAPATLTTGNLGAVQCNSKGEPLTQLTDGTTNVAVIAGTTALKTDLSSVAGTATVTGGVAGIQAVGGNVANAVTATSNPVPVGGIFTTTPTTLTTGQTATLQFTAAQNVKEDVTTIAGTATATAAAGVQKVGIVGNANAAVDAATGAAPPANALLIAGLTSGATNGFLTAVPICDSYKPINVVTATTVLLVTGVSGRHVRICSLHVIQGATAENIAFVEGTGATCGTTTVGLSGGATAATGWVMTASRDITMGSGIGTIMRTSVTGNSVCLITSTTSQISGGMSYAIY